MSSARQPAHPSRRTNQSVSSNVSVASSSRTERGSTRANPSPAVESAVTRLLVSIKALLESLTQWSKQEVDENQVSDVYVRLGNDFNAAVGAFAAFSIDMTELLTVPEDLRSVLETCLSEDATPENLEIYLPAVRKIITHLLQGLRGKQSIYRRIVSDHKHRSDLTASDRESKSRFSQRDDGAASRTQSARAAMPSTSDRDSLARRSATSSTRRKQSASDGNPVPSTTNESPEPFVGGFVPGVTANGDATPSTLSRSSTPVAPRPQLAHANGYPVRAHSTSAVDQTFHPPSNGTEVTPSPLPEHDTPRTASAVPGHVKRYSLIDRPVSSTPPPPAVVVDGTPIDDAPPAETPTVETPISPGSLPPPDDSPPAVQNSLAALKKSDALERRASKRFSTYNISKMTGGSLRERHGAGSHPNRRSLAAASGGLTLGDLAVLTEEDVPSPGKKRDRSRAPTRSRGPSPIAEGEEPPPLPPLPPLPPKAPSPQPVATLEHKPPEPPEHAAQQPKAPDDAANEAAHASVSSLQSPSDSTSRSFPVFLQVGREVKKVVIEPGLSFASLRVLFVDRFAYSPGQDNFPAIYIRDPSNGVQYELEDVDEVKEKCLLSLNIEPLDQIKQHIDTQMSALSQDIKDLRSMVASSRRASHPPMIMAQPIAESTPSATRPTDRQLRNVARRLSRIIPDEEATPIAPWAPPELVPQLTGSTLQPQMTGTTLQPQMTGTSITSDYTARVVMDLKTQFDEVQNLRRDLGIMRQLYTEFMKQTKESLSALRSQTQSVRQLATTKVGGARGYIDTGKTKLDTRSSNVLTRMEELQDTVEGIKDDVLKRNVSPKASALKAVRSDIDAVAMELQNLKEHIQTIKPMWKKTWEEELQNIVEEQQFLQHQEEFLGDLLEDYKAVDEVLGHVEKVISLRGASTQRSRRGYKPPPMEEGHTGLSTVMLEIRGAAVDAERRMKAIAANEKNREKELASRSDEFQKELSGFVTGKKLKMTGGADEVERVRQRRNELTLKAMFNGGPTSPMIGSGSALPSPVVPSPTSSAAPALDATAIANQGES